MNIADIYCGHILRTYCGLQFKFAVATHVLSQETGILPPRNSIY
jgi:hypothetical protein